MGESSRLEQDVRKTKKCLLITSATLVALLLAAALLLWRVARREMGSIEGARLARIERSPQWREGHFRNRLPASALPFFKSLRAWLFESPPHSTPTAPVPTEPRQRADYDLPPETGLRVTWLGHSTSLLELDGARLLIDPVWSETAAPFSFLGTKRFYPSPLPLDALPPIDIVLLSHDHYDHLDRRTVIELLERTRAGSHPRWMVPLGVGAHLENWGVPPDEIDELDWWETIRHGPLILTATPARHFSGRWLGSGSSDTTLWCGWAIVGPKSRVYYAGDTAMTPELAEIGPRLGPFDLSIIEIGAYSAFWPDVHIGPEQAIRAHELVGAKALLPVHWGLFDLALHGWTEPIERLVAAAKSDTLLALPRPGGRVEPSRDALPPARVERWWPSLPWQQASEAPMVSTGL